MIKTTISKTEYNLPSSWNDVTFLKYCDVVMAQGEPFMNRLSVYAGIESDILNKLTFNGIAEIANIVSFMDSPDDVNSFQYLYDGAIQVGHETYGKMIISQQAIKKAKTPLFGAVVMVKQYTGEDISHEPITKCIGKALYFFKEVNTFLEGYKELNDYQPDGDELEAGIEQLNRFGPHLTATVYARKNNMKRPEDVYALPAKEVYTTLLMDYLENKIEKKLGHVRERNRKIREQQGR